MASLAFTGYENYCPFNAASLAAFSWKRNFSDGIAQLIVTPNLDEILTVDVQSCVLSVLGTLLEQAFQGCEEDALFKIHKTFFFLLNQHVEEPGSYSTLHQYHPFLMKVRAQIVGALENAQKDRLPNMPDYSSYKVEDFTQEIKAIWRGHPAFSHSFFDFLQKHATADHIKQYVARDYALNVRFYELIVLSMVAAPEETRAEVAHNFWDEMGNGDPKRTHIQLLRNVLEVLDIRDNPETFINLLGWRGLAGYNLLLDYTQSRRHYFRAIGAMAITELADPDQYVKFVAGCSRVGLHGEWLEYYTEHIDVDAIHGDGWIDNVIAPMARQFPEQRREIIEGCYMRLNSSYDYWDEVVENFDKN